MTSPAIELARDAATGNVQAIGQLLRDVAPRVTAVVRAVLGRDHADVEDVVQQGLITLIQVLPSFRGECEPASFASRIAVRIAVGVRKKRRAHEQRCVSEDEAGVATNAPTPQDAAQSSRRAALVRELLETLPEEQAECLAFRVVLGWSLEEVSRVSGAPINTVRSRVRLAKEALRKRIEADPRLADELEVSK